MYFCCSVFVLWSSGRVLQCFPPSTTTGWLFSTFPSLYNHQVTILASWGAAHTVGMLKYFSIVGFVFFKSPSSQKQRLWPQTRERKRHSSSWLGICHHCRKINVSIFPCNFNKSDLTGCRIKLHFFPLLCHCNFWQNDSWSHQNKLRKIRPNPAAE